MPSRSIRSNPRRPLRYTRSSADPARVGPRPGRFGRAGKRTAQAPGRLREWVPEARPPPFAPRDPGSSEYPQRTTPSSRPPSGFVTVTHPHHPLLGQRVEIVQIRRGNDPDLIVVLPDGRHTAIALSSTDYDSNPEIPPTVTAKHLLDLDGLRRVIQLLDRLAQAEHAASTIGDRVQTQHSEPR